jgi:hypothetical protein
MKKLATTFAIRGAIDPEAARRIASAVREIDPAASVAVSLSQRIARVQSSATVEQIQHAIAAHGFVAEISTRALSSQPPPGVRARPAGARACCVVVARALRFGLLFALVVPVITFVVGLGVQHFDTACRDSDGCTIRLVSATILSIAPSAVLGFLMALVRGIVRLRTSATR